MNSAPPSRQPEHQPAPLTAAAIYLVRATTTGLVKPEDRPQSAHRLFRRLHALGVPLFLLLLVHGLRQLLRPTYATRLGRALVEDHASRPVMTSLERCGLLTPTVALKKERPSRPALLRALLTGLPAITQAYAAAAPVSAFDVWRVLRLMSFHVFWRAVFQETRPAVVYLARSNDQKRMALGVVAEEFSVPVVAWTIERRGSRPPAPFATAAVLCWSRSQREELERQGFTAVQMPTTKLALKAMEDAALRNGALGMLLNARVKADTLRAFLQDMGERSGLHRIQVRPHPGAVLTQEDLPACAELRDWREPLPAFLESVQAAICMSSGSMFDALLHGVPIIYRSGLDDLGHDVTGLLRAGVIPELRAAEDPVAVLRAHYDRSEVNLSLIDGEYTTDRQPEHEILQHHAP